MAGWFDWSWLPGGNQTVTKKFDLKSRPQQGPSMNDYIMYRNARRGERYDEMMANPPAMDSPSMKDPGLQKNNVSQKYDLTPPPPVGTQQGPSMEDFILYRNAQRQGRYEEELSRMAQAADQAPAEIAKPRPVQGPSMEDYILDRNRRRQETYETMMAQEQRSRDPMGPPAPSGPPNSSGKPENWEDWSTLDKFGGLFTPEGAEAYRTYRAAPDQPAQVAGQSPSSPARSIMFEQPASPAPTTQPTARPPNAATVSVVPASSQENSQPVDPLEAIRQQKAMIDALYPQRPEADIGQAAIDAELAKEKERAAIMARLAFFSGITAAGGEGWDQVAKGFAAAGGAYSEGFDRYQKALENRAERMQRQTDRKYEDEVTRSDAAIGLYKQQQDLEKSRQSEARLRIKERQADIDEYFKQRLKIAEGNDFAPPDEDKFERILRDWRISRDRGEIVSINEKPEGK